jgi:hypothetical protein
MIYVSLGRLLSWWEKYVSQRSEKLAVSGSSDGYFNSSDIFTLNISTRVLKMYTRLPERNSIQFINILLGDEALLKNRTKNETLLIPAGV